MFHENDRHEKVRVYYNHFIEFLPFIKYNEIIILKEGNIMLNLITKNKKIFELNIASLTGYF